MTTTGAAMNIRLGVWLDELGVGIRAGLNAIAPLRAEAIGLDAFSAELAPRDLSHSGRRDLAQLIRSRGTSLSALRADVGGRRLADAQTLDSNLTRLRDAMQMAHDLGAFHIVVPAGFLPAAGDKENATARAALTEAARALTGFASTLGVQVCWLGGHEAPEVLAEFLDAVESSGLLEVDLNPGAYVMCGVDPLKALNLLARRVSMARAVDHYRGGAESPFGKGDVRWGEVLIGLSTLQRNTPIDVLAGCALPGERLGALSAACKQLQALRSNPVLSAARQPRTN